MVIDLKLSCIELLLVVAGGHLARMQGAYFGLFHPVYLRLSATATATTLSLAGKVRFDSALELFEKSCRNLTQHLIHLTGLDVYLQ